MPSTHPRVPLTMPDELRQVYVEYAEALGKPLASAIVELLDGMTPQIKQLTHVMREVQAGRVQAAAQLTRKMLGDAAIPAAHAQHELESALTQAAPPAVKKGSRRK